MSNFVQQFHSRKFFLVSSHYTDPFLYFWNFVDLWGRFLMLNPNNFFFGGGELSRRTNRQYQFNVYLLSVSLDQIRISLKISIALKRFAQRSREGSSPSSLKSFSKKTLESTDFNPLQDESFRGYSRTGRGQKGPPSLKFVTHILHGWNLAQLYLP